MLKNFILNRIKQVIFSIFLLFSFFLCGNILADTKINYFSFTRDSLQTTSFVEVIDWQFYHQDTYLTDKQKELLTPFFLKGNKNIPSFFTTLDSNEEPLFGSEERLIGYDKEYWEKLWPEDLQEWGEENDNLVRIEESSEDFNEPIPFTTKTIKEFDIAPQNDVIISVNEKRVNAFIHLYTKKKRKIFTTGLKRAPKYYQMVQRIFQEYGLPHDLFYLAMVESNFNYKAVSRARAVGLWQFIASTGKMYGMTYSWWHDDRLDPEKITYAAAKFLKDLYLRYEDWALVLAAYNSGVGNVNKAIRKNKKLGKSTDYWSLKLPRETRGYVPAFLAVVHIFNNLEQYNFTFPEKSFVWPKYKNVKIGPSISLQQISQKTDLSIQELKQYNPALKYSMTPFDKGNYQLKIPDYANISSQQIAKLQPDITDNFITYRVREGDNLWTISRRYQTSLKFLYALNPQLISIRYLKPNQKILIPVAIPKQKEVSSGKVHIVKKGDSLWSISRKYKVSMRSLVNKNYHLKSFKDVIVIGSKIKI